MFEVTYTVSIAIVGTSEIMMRRNALAMDASTPSISKMSWSAVFLMGEMVNSFLKVSMFHSLSTLVEPKVLYESAYATCVTESVGEIVCRNGNAD